jgi:hypothetical protein
MDADSGFRRARVGSSGEGKNQNQLILFIDETNSQQVSGINTKKDLKRYPMSQKHGHASGVHMQAVRGRGQKKSLIGAASDRPHHLWQQKLIRCLLPGKWTKLVAATFCSHMVQMAKSTAQCHTHFDIH